jgi:amylosucrase
MLRMICEIVCPGVLLLGEVVMEPIKVAPYFGTVEKPECHMLYNVTTMATMWHTVATGETALLKRQMDIVNTLPKEYVFLNYLRCHDDIGWGLEYDWLRTKGNEEIPHKKYLNDFLTGKYPGSFARGELYNDDPVSQDARLCGTTASLCGLEKAVEEQDAGEVEKAVRFIQSLHGYMLTQSGIPVIYSGDEVGQFNDNNYRKNPKKADDSRYIHRGDFQWELAKLRKKAGSYQQEIFDCLSLMEKLRAQHPVFLNQAAVWTVETHDPALLGVNRAYGEEKLTALFNFCREDRTAWIQEEGSYCDLLTGEILEGRAVPVKACGMRWLMRE